MVALMTRVIASFCGILVMALTPVSAGAHGLGIEGRLRGGTLHLEAYFDDNSPVAHAQVRLLNQENKTLVEAETNTEGVYTLPTPAPRVRPPGCRSESPWFSCLPPGRILPARHSPRTTSR